MPDKFDSGRVVDEVHRLNAELQEHVRAHGDRLVAVYERLAEAERSHSHLAAIVESADDAIISKSLDGIVQSWNPGAERLFGYRADEMIGEPITRLIPPEQENEEIDILQRLKRGELIDHYEAARCRKDRTVVAVSLTISPVRDSAGNIIGASKMARDLTDRKNYEAQSILIAQLQKALAEITTLRGLIPICGWCKKIRDDKNFWLTVEEYIGERTGAHFTHGICPECSVKAMREFGPKAGESTNDGR